jgi:hypothetical protein
MSQVSCLEAVVCIKVGSRLQIWYADDAGIIHRDKNAVLP